VNIISNILSTPVPLATVSSYSMDPTLHIGDMIVVVGSNLYREGDIIVFERGSNLIVHRLVRITDTGKYVTKGDANPTEDLRPIERNKVKGKVLLIVPYLGILSLIYSRSPWLLYSVLIVIVVIIVIKYIRERGRKSEE